MMRSWRRVNVPHDWSIEGPFEKNSPTGAAGLSSAGIGWYRKQFTLRAGDQQRKVFVGLDGVCPVDSYLKTDVTIRALPDESLIQTSLWPYTIKVDKHFSLLIAGAQRELLAIPNRCRREESPPLHRSDCFSRMVLQCSNRAAHSPCAMTHHSKSAFSAPAASPFRKRQSVSNEEVILLNR